MIAFCPSLIRPSQWHLSHVGGRVSTWRAQRWHRRAYGRQILRRSGDHTERHRGPRSNGEASRYFQNGCAASHPSAWVAGCKVALLAQAIGLDQVRRSRVLSLRRCEGVRLRIYLPAKLLACRPRYLLGHCMHPPRQGSRPDRSRPARIL